MNTAEPFYAKGLHFECTRCSACCRHDPGFVFLSEKDLTRLANHLAISNDQFKERYCRVVDFGIVSRLSLTEKSNNDCIMWQTGGCSVYQARPLQCRSFPFWSSNVEDRASWEAAAIDCPGIHRGKLHDKAEIESWLQTRLDEPLLEK